jgi:hypothetical protein
MASFIGRLIIYFILFVYLGTFWTVLAVIIMELSQVVAISFVEFCKETCGHDKPPK